ncbi:OLC1v1006562C1 [Oldenlandia corymbosa var. corymbosa]|uniref:E2 ubiquitin-conjugating enzyme n=1 Tax=Oldenlandia corymbosa var. corymbosa TaxID=529605 RepID=A0AAV1DHC0_OLDCO|nr:OLC1v1006562C1 [Oldenlandia corymbosa var. corymbosa]
MESLPQHQSRYFLRSTSKRKFISGSSTSAGDDENPTSSNRVVQKKKKQKVVQEKQTSPEEEKVVVLPVDDVSITKDAAIDDGSIDLLLNFKRFDMVENFPDHHFSSLSLKTMQPPKAWAKKVQDEWNILEHHLPDTIFVRVCESRMDLLRAVIIGAQGTPYHDGLFFFDVFFPINYPSVPPQVYYYSRGHRINPNLYNDGYVCLSLLNTWRGSAKERWIPNESTVLQVLVSIQGLVLNANPYFNEPAYAGQSGSPYSKSVSMQYSEDALILSLKTMVCSIKNPPHHFEELVAGHFSRRGRDILVACKSYIDDGAQVGCLVKGVVQDAGNDVTKCSDSFRNQLAGYITTIVEAFKTVNVKDCDEFLSLAKKTVIPEKITPLKKEVIAEKVLSLDDQKAASSGKKSAPKMSTKKKGKIAPKKDTPKKKEKTALAQKAKTSGKKSATKKSTITPKKKGKIAPKKDTSPKKKGKTTPKKSTLKKE